MRHTPRQINDIDRDFQQKERQEFSVVPDTKIRRRGERELYTPNNDDDYAIVNTRHGWKTIAFLNVASAIPSNDVGQDGEVRVNTTTNKLIFKSNGTWYTTP